MNSRIHGSEDALAEHTCARLMDCAQPRLLIGVSDVNYFVRSASIILAGLLTFISLLDSSFVGRDYVRLLAGK
jgi:hypothetical protein